MPDRLSAVLGAARGSTSYGKGRRKSAPEMPACWDHENTEGLSPAGPSCLAWWLAWRCLWERCAVPATVPDRCGPPPRHRPSHWRLRPKMAPGHPGLYCKRPGEGERQPRGPAFQGNIEKAQLGKGRSFLGGQDACLKFSFIFSVLLIRQTADLRDLSLSSRGGIRPGGLICEVTVQ